MGLVSIAKGDIGKKKHICDGESSTLQVAEGMILVDSNWQQVPVTVNCRYRNRILGDG